MSEQEVNVRFTINIDLYGKKTLLELAKLMDQVATHHGFDLQGIHIENFINDSDEDEDWKQGL